MKSMRACRRIDASALDRPAARLPLTDSSANSAAEQPRYLQGALALPIRASAAKTLQFQHLFGIAAQNGALIGVGNSQPRHMRIVGADEWIVGAEQDLTRSHR